MKKTEASFLHDLELLGKEQARIEGSSPVPEFMRPLAKMLGEHNWQALFLSSLVLSIFISVWFYPLILQLFDKGILAWLLR